VVGWVRTNPQICINIHPDAVPPIHAESYHAATDKVPAQNGDKFRTQAESGGHIVSSVVRTRCSAGPVLPLWTNPLGDRDAVKII